MVHRAHHIVNAFPVLTEDRAPVLLLPYRIEPLDGRTRRAGDVSFALGQQLATVATPRGTGDTDEVVALWPDGRPPPESVELVVSLRNGRRFRLTRLAPVSVSPVAPSSGRKLLRRLAESELKHALVYRAARHFYRMRGYYQHSLVPLAGGAFARGMSVHFLWLEEGMAVALDAAMCPVSAPLDQLAPGERRRYLLESPYPRGKQRNFLYEEDGLLRRVYVLAERTASDPAEHVWIRRLRDQGDPWAVSAGQLRAVLAPWECDRVFGRREWEEARTCQPDQRRDLALAFIREHLREIPHLGRLAQVGTEPCVAGDGMHMLSWPRLSVGDAGHAVKAGENRVEHRMEALAAHGPRRWSESLGRMEIVAVTGREHEAEKLKAECQALLQDWHIPALEVRISPAKMGRGADAAAVRPVIAHYERLPRQERPALLIVFKDRGRWRTDEADPAYHAVHKELGDGLGMAVKPVQSLRGDLRSQVINIVPGLIMRAPAGAVLWGLADHPGASKERPGLYHDLCIGLDIGGRDRGGVGGNERAAAVAMAGDGAPVFWVPPPGAELSGEVLDEELAPLILGAARDLKKHHRRGWLYVRDGQIHEEERAALERIAERAVSEGLLAEHMPFAAAAVYKDHPFRIFKVGRDGRWEQPDAGVAWWNTADHHGLLATTGGPFDLPSSADPLRVEILRVRGPIKPLQVLQDLWRQTHLNYSAPRGQSRLPVVLKCVERLLEDLARGRSARLLPF